MKIKDYVRTNDGYINKIKKVNQWNILVDARDLFGEEINIANNEIIKSSPNIIDLIEVGDLVYVDISPDNSGGIIVPRIAETENELNLFKQLLENGWVIKSIITREQLGSIKYKVGE